MICHKDTGKGGKMTQDGKTINPDDLTTAKMKAMTDEKLNGYVTNGIEDEGMPAFKGKLTTDEIKSVIRHVRTLQN
jgi:mono/diheme cytochrome c family protein